MQYVGKTRLRPPNPPPAHTLSPRVAVVEATHNLADKMRHTNGKTRHAEHGQSPKNVLLYNKEKAPGLRLQGVALPHYLRGLPAFGGATRLMRLITAHSEYPCEGI